MLSLTSDKTIELVSTASPNYEVHIYDVPEDDLRCCSASLYAHGKLEKALHYDILNVINYKKFDYTIDSEGYKHIILPDGIYECMVVGGSICRAYIWNTKLGTRNRTIGLVCFPTDEEAIKDAETKYLEKKSWI